MSMIHERYICPNCGGYDMTGMGSFCRKLSSRCKCDDEQEAKAAEPKRKAAA
jgi:hypothetical protein